MKVRLFFTGALIIGLLGCKPGRESSPGHSIEAQGDRLYLEYRGAADVVQFQMFEGISVVLEEQKPGVFSASLEMPGAEEAVFSYEMIAHRKDSTGRMVRLVQPSGLPSSRFHFIGPVRRPEFQKSEKLAGDLRDTLLSSAHLGFDRKVTLYFPPAVSGETPVFYLTDGSSVGTYAPYVDALIREKRISPVVLVGVHASDDHRYEEYVNNGIPNEYFPRHEAFFLEEVIPQIETQLPDWKGARYLYGVSNGAAFCMFMGLNYPDLFTEVVAFSTADYITEMIRPIEFKYEAYPSFYLGAGRYEENFFQDNKRFAEKLYRKGIEVEWKAFVAGHDAFTWRYEFLEYLTNMF